MVDIVTSAVRSRMMSGIRNKDTRPELVLRRNLHRAGYRYRLHVHDMPGRPDLVFPRHQAALFAHGCFWHGHDCALFRWPQSRVQFWQEKIRGNQHRDTETVRSLLEGGWRVGIVWECSLKGSRRIGVDVVITRCVNWLESSKSRMDIRGL